jgi:hypothetical protein
LLGFKNPVRITLTLAMGISITAGVARAQSCPHRTLKAHVAAIDQPLTYNRLGASQPGGMIFALTRDVYPLAGWGDPAKSCDVQTCAPGFVQLRADKRPRPLVLRASQGDDLEIAFTNLLSPSPKLEPSTSALLGAQTQTRAAGVNVNGLELTQNINDDASFVGANTASTIDPGKSTTYHLHAVAEGAYFLSSMAANLGGTGFGQVSAGLFGAVNVEPQCGHFYRSQVTSFDLLQGSKGKTTPTGQPKLEAQDYDAVYAPGTTYPGTNIVIPPNTPIFAIVNSAGEIVHSDLTAIIAGPRTDANHQGWWPDNTANPLFRPNPASPERNQPFREFTIIYHSDFTDVQAFPDQYYSDPQTLQHPKLLNAALSSTTDAFGINYGFGGIGGAILANRLNAGPSAKCAECKYEEFFLSSWATGDPAMVVDVNATDGKATGKTASTAFYPDDPSNVYHSYLNDHTKFRILSADSDLHHIHHQHAHQWLHTPNSDESAYLDSQAIGPGSAFTLEIAYGGSGNRNKTPGDSIFHCHFYPHFAEGMWSLWRVHDTFEAGSVLESNGHTVKLGSRALPDGEILSGTPIPALVPIPSLPMAPMPSDVFIQNGQVVYGKLASPDPNGQNVTVNPGFPFFIPGIAGHRAPAPPLDFAIDPNTHKPSDGGLPRNVITAGTFHEFHTQYNFTKDLTTLQAKELDESGTKVEKVAMTFNEHSPIASSRPNGAPGGFVVNGHGRQQGAPYADPCPVHPSLRRYKAADIQLDVIFNKKGWHYPQQRMISLWGDVTPTLFGDSVSGTNQKAPEPLFFRAKSTECIEYWQTNLVPSNYELDNFQVRTPTDVLGQHIHLVKFDVTSSDGAANGFNYEDASLSPQEVQERIAALTSDPQGMTGLNGTKLNLKAVPPPFFCDDPNSVWFSEYCKGATGKWVGAQTTIQRWWADPLLSNATPGHPAHDRTIRTVFTHDHLGPSTHQQAGLYAGLVVEPEDSEWRMPTEADPQDPNKGRKMGDRFDGGPTSWQADIITGAGGGDSYREFVLAFQDLQLAYLPRSKDKLGVPSDGYDQTDMTKLRTFGWFDSIDQVINPPANGNAPGCENTGLFPPPFPNPEMGCSTPELVSAAFTEGTYSLNYRNEPVPFRVWDPASQSQPGDKTGDLAKAFLSIPRADSDLNKQPHWKPGTPDTLASIQNNPPNQKGGTANATPYPNPLQPLGADGVDFDDPFTPMLRAYQGDKVQVRLLAGSHLSPHDFSIPGLNWLFEPSYADSGYRNTQVMGISEHFEMLFTLPPTGGDADYAYVADSSTGGLQNGLWGILRAYDASKSGKKPALPFLPNNPKGTAAAGQTNGCPAGAFHQPQPYKVSAINNVSLNLNSRLGVSNPNGMIYVLAQDKADVLNGKRSPEPLVLRPQAGECVRVELTNEFTTTAPIFTDNTFAVPQNEVLGPNGGFPYSNFPAPTANYNISLFTSQSAGLHPQLLAYDVTKNDGLNVGRNPVHTVAAAGCTPHCTQTYEWWAGALYNPTSGKYAPHAAEFGATNLLSADLLQQHQQGLYGALIVEPAGAKVQVDENSRTSATVTPPAGKAFRDFVVILNDDLAQSSATTSSAVDYGVEPWLSRMGLNIPFRAFNGQDLSCGLSNKLVTPNLSPTNAVGELRTPIFAVGAGQPARLHVLNPGGVNDHIFELHGHAWQEEPYSQGSAVIGNNPLSQWQGMRMGHGPTNHFDVVLSSAGGAKAVKGDYLYRSHHGLGFRSGMFGVVRVIDPGKDNLSITTDLRPSITPKTLVGFLTVNLATGKLASGVDVFNGVPSGSGCTGAKLGAATVGSQGFWRFPLTTTPTKVCAVSSFGAVASMDLTTPLPNACCPGCKSVSLTPSDARSILREKTEQMSKPNPTEKRKE